MLATPEPAVSIAKPATPARERHAAPAPRVEAVRPPHGHEPVVTWSIIGAALFVAIIHLISGRR
jgi:hypothetical protein